MILACYIPAPKWCKIEIVGWVIPIPHLKGKRLKQGLKRFLLDCHIAGVFVWNGLVFSPIPHPYPRTRIANAPMWCIPSPLHSVPITTPPHHHCTNVVHHSVPIINEQLCQCTNVVHHSVPIMVAHQCGASLCPHYGSAPMWCITLSPLW